MIDDHETDISDEGYCTNCGKEHPSIKMIDGEQLCNRCRTSPGIKFPGLITTNGLTFSGREKNK
jgi:hypothetical protein